MNTQAQVEAIRARVADEYWQATEGARHDLGTFSDLALADLRTLLAILDAQQRVIEAAGAGFAELALFACPLDRSRIQAVRARVDALAGMGG